MLKQHLTDEELVEKALELARMFYSMLGYKVEVGFKFYDSKHPQEQMVWDMACEAFDFIRGSDVHDALSAIEGE